MPAPQSKAERIASATSFDGFAAAAQVAAVSSRAPLRGELLVLAVGTSSTAYNVPDGSIEGQPSWINRHVNMQAHGGDVFVQFSSGTDASVDDATTSTVTQVQGRSSLAPAGNECWVIHAGRVERVPVPAGAKTFAVKGSVACKLRTALAET
jgi:hypothetical protein